MATEKKAVSSELSDLTGVQKAAIFMLALDQEHSGMLFQLMEETPKLVWPKHDGPTVF